MRQRSGFILIIVVALLGVLGFLAISLLEESQLARKLSMNHLHESQTYLAARSGVEKGKQWILRPYLLVGDRPQAEPLAQPTLPVVLPVDGTLSASVRISDTSGKICVNDGLMAGQAELGSAYDPRALDPWPPTNPGQQDVSAWINLRLRSLLNAYGDVQRFQAWQTAATPATGGWPECRGPGTEPTYNNSTNIFDHSATDTDNRFNSIPPRTMDGLATTASGSSGLGDRIIGSRPDRGYADEEELREIVNGWWLANLPVDYSESGDFFERVSYDFTVEAWHDTAFWRMKREFGANHPIYTTQADYQSDMTSPLTGALMDIEATPPDFTDLWKPHPVTPLHLNTASDAVRAAVFHAPVNVSVVAEGVLTDTVAWSAPYTFGALSAIQSKRPTLGVAAPLARSANMKENGMLLNTGFALTKFQRNRLMSVRDAMICAQAYREIAMIEGWPDSFERFAWHLRRFLVNGGYQVRTLERANVLTPSPVMPPHNSAYGYVPSELFPSAVSAIAAGDPGGAITQWALVEFLPHILSCQRRLPSWMGAPLALVSPWRQHVTSHEFTRSIEDFVFRSPLPKVMFQPSGAYLLTSVAHIHRGSISSRRRIRAVVQAMETTVLRDQASFASVTDVTQTSTDILIGPEPGNLKSPFLGTVGLKDRGELIPFGTRLHSGGLPVGTRYDFTGEIRRHASSSANFIAERSAIDVDNGITYGVAPGFGQQELQNSPMENHIVSIFPRAGFDAGDISPFGGLYFSSFNHGPHRPAPFGDSFYFRPNKFAIASDGITGTLGNSGLISMWVRMPTGHKPSGTLMHMTLWEKMTATLGPAYPGPTEERLRPNYFHLYLSGKRPCFAASTGHFGNGPNGPPAILYSGYQFQDWDITMPPILNPLPLPADATDYASNPVFRKAMLPWSQGTAANYWWQEFTTNGAAGATEALATESQISPAGYYFYRPGSWVRLVARWDFSKISQNNAKLELVTHAHPPGTVFTNSSSSNNGLMNPKMVMSFGERHYQVRPASSSTFTSAVGTLLPVNRLNSCIDNIVVQFGGFPNNQFETVPNNTATETQVYNAVQAIAGFDNRRYNIRPTGHPLGLSEPAWVIQPKLPSGARILQFGARIYDVPFNPEFDAAASTTFGTWPVLAPRVDLDIVDGGNVVMNPIRSSLPIVDQGIAIHSRAWSSYPLVRSEGTRFRLTYRSVDAMDRPLTADVLSDIPWIQEVNWNWIPAGGMRVLSWKQD
ncbi:MAG: hypothetical protein AB7F75_01995 [Planctomycetota bacterium]